MTDLKLRILLDAVDKATAPLKRVRDAAAGLRQPLNQTVERLKALESTSQQLQKFRDVQVEASRNAVALGQAQKKAQGLGQAMAAASAPTAKLKTDFAAARAETSRLQTAEAAASRSLERAQEKVRKLSAQVSAATAPTDKLRQRLAEASASTTALAAAKQSASTALEASRRRTASLGQAMEAAEASTAKLRREFATARGQVQTLDQAQQRSRAELQQLRRHLAGAGVDTRSFGAEQKRLKAEIAAVTAAAEQQAAAMKRMAATRRAINENKERRAELTGQLFETTALVTSLALPITSAVKFESVMADVKKVVDFDTPDQFRQMSADVLEMSTRIPMAAEGIGAIVAAAGQAGIARGELTRFAADAAKMGVAFDMTGDQAGSTMTGLRTQLKLNQDGVMLLGDAFNHLSNNMDARASDIVDVTNRTAGLAKMFGLTGQQLGAMSATMLALKTPPEVAGTAINALLGRLQTAPQQTKEFQAALAGIGISAEGMRDAIKINAQGALNQFFSAVEKAPDQMATLTSLFGAEYAPQMAKLVGSLDVYRQSLGLVAKEAEYAGSMEREYQERSATTANNLTLLVNRANRLAITLGSILLPALNSVVGAIGGAADWLVKFAEMFPTVTKVAVTAVTALVALKVATVLGGLAASYATGGWLHLRFAWQAVTSGALATRAATLLNTIATQADTAAARLNAGATRARGWASMEQATATARGTAATRASTAATLASGRASLFTAAGWRMLGGSAAKVLASGFSLVTAGIRIMSAAMLTNPIGLLVMAIAAAGFLIYRYWQPLKVFFSGVWDGLKEGLAPVMASLAPLAPLGQVIADVFADAVKMCRELGTALAPLWSMVSDLFGGITDQAQMTQEEMAGVSSAGVLVGRVLGGAISLATWPIRTLIGLYATLWQWFQAVLAWSPMATVKAVWAPVGEFFDGIWSAIVGKAEAAMERVSNVISSAKALWSGIFGGGDGTPKIPAPAARSVPVAAPLLAARNSMPTVISASAGAANNNLPQVRANDAPLPRVVPVPVAGGNKAQASPVTHAPTYNISITGTPGMSAQDIAREVDRQMRERERAAASAVRSRQYDTMG